MNCKPLGELALLFSGGTPKTSEKTYWNGNYPWLSSGETGNRYINQTDKTITEIGIKKSSTKLAKQGDIVIASAGQGKTRGQTAYCNIDTYINQSVVAVRADSSQIDSKWLFYNLTNRYNEMRSLSDSHSIRGSLTTKILKILDIKYPPLDTQKKIADILSSLDDKIELNQKMNKTLEQMAQTIFKSWFVDFDPIHAKGHCTNKEELDEISKKLGISRETLELFPNEFKESEEGLIPKGWNVKSIYEAADIIFGAPFSSKQFNDSFQGKPLIRIRDLKTFNSQHWTKEIHPKGSLITAGDLLIGMDAEFTPTIWQGIDGWLNQRVLKVVPINNTYTAFHYFALQPKMKFFEQANVGTTVIHLGKKDIDTINLIIPDDELLRESRKVIQPLFDKLVQNSIEIRELQKTRDVLLPKLLSGEVTV